VNIVAIIGSPQGMKGSTGKLLEAVLDAAKKAGADVKTFSLAELHVKPCVACGACHKTGECPIQDDFKPIRDALLSADGIVLASPNYMFSVTAQMKALMDRCCGPMHCQALEGRHGAAVVTSGGAGSREVEKYLLRFLRAVGCWTVGSIGAEARTLISEDTRPAVLRKASALGKRLVKAIRTRRTFSRQEKERRASFERMKALVTLRKDEWPYELNYWKSRGRL
jgi:multimeric flavodoxin WrbA